MILAVGGAALGALFAWGGLKFLIALIPQEIIPAEATIRLNITVLLFTLGVSVATALVFGLVPALQTARRDLNDPLRDSRKGSQRRFPPRPASRRGGRSRSRGFRSLLLVWCGAL